MAPRKPSGIVDDIFRPLGYKVVNQVRNLVRHRNSSEVSSVKRAKTALTSQKKGNKTVGDVIAKADLRIKAKVSSNKNPVVVRSRKLDTAKAEVISEKTKLQKRTKTATKATKAEDRFKTLDSQARAMFPSDASYAKAVREERAAVNLEKQKRLGK